MSDLIERLRAEAEDWDCPRGFDEVDMHGLLAGAADYITTLEAKLAVAREALEYVCAADEVEYARLYARQALQEIEQ